MPGPCRAYVEPVLGQDTFFLGIDLRGIKLWVILVPCWACEGKAGAIFRLRTACSCGPWHWCPHEHAVGWGSGLILAYVWYLCLMHIACAGLCQGVNWTCSVMFDRGYFIICKSPDHAIEKCAETEIWNALNEGGHKGPYGHLRLRGFKFLFQHIFQLHGRGFYI